MTIYTLSAVGEKELTVATRVMQSFLKKLSTSVADNVKYKQMKVDTYTQNPRADFDLHTGYRVCHQPKVKLGGFRSRLEESRVSSHTEELWYNETVCLLMIYIYIMIKI